MLKPLGLYRWADTSMQNILRKTNFVMKANNFIHIRKLFDLTHSSVIQSKSIPMLKFSCTGRLCDFFFFYSIRKVAMCNVRSDFLYQHYLKRAVGRSDFDIWHYLKTCSREEWFFISETIWRRALGRSVFYIGNYLKTSSREEWFFV